MTDTAHTGTAYTGTDDYIAAPELLQTVNIAAALATLGARVLVIDQG